MVDSPVFDLAARPLHLGLGARALVQPAFDGSMGWYEAYGQRHGGDGVEGRLVAVHAFDAPWSTWEVHPHGEELVVCLAGRITLHQERDGAVRTVVLEPLQAVVNPAGVWHTADVADRATALFITPGLGTGHRPR
jgi:mannose-6-phosphate isomerase-like protein (cupin superfamily)